MSGKKFDICTKKIKNKQVNGQIFKIYNYANFLSKSYNHELQSKFVARHYPFTHPFKKKKSFQNKFDHPLVSPIGF